VDVTPATSAGVAPLGVAIDRAGNLVIVDGINMRVRVVAESTGTFYGQKMTAGDIYTVAGNGIPGFAGDGGPANNAEFQEPQGVAVDSAGNIIVADTQTSLVPSETGNNRVRVAAAATGTFYGVPMTAGGHLHGGRERRPRAVRRWPRRHRGRTGRAGGGQRGQRGKRACGRRR
jgi:DNA-binding beta-propeller fold protein YncE